LQRATFDEIILKYKLIKISMKSPNSKCQKCV